MTILQVQAKHYEFTYDPDHTALILIDFQREFFLSGGFGEALGNNPAYLQAAVDPSKRVLQAVRNYGMQVIHTREGHKPDLSDCPESKRMRGNLELKIGDQGPMGRILIRGEYGHGIIDELAPIEGEIVIDKPGKGAFYNTDLDEQLRSRDIRYLAFLGATTEVCIQSTLREANDRGYESLVLSDCVASYKPELHDAALRMITSQGGILGWVAHSSDFLESLKVD